MSPIASTTLLSRLASFILHSFLAPPVCLWLVLATIYHGFCCTCCWRHCLTGRQQHGELLHERCEWIFETVGAVSLLRSNRPTSSNGSTSGLTHTVPTSSKQENRARKMELAKAEDEYDGAGAAPGLEVRRRRRKHGK